MGGRYAGEGWLPRNLDSKKSWGSSPLQRYQTTYICGDKWANVFCQILHPEPRGSCLHWKPIVWLSRVGLMSRRNGRGADLCVSALSVCLCTRLWHNGGQASQYKWSWRYLARVDGIWVWWEFSPRVGVADWSRQRPEDLGRHVLGRLLDSPTPSFSWRPYRSHRNTCYRI